MIEVLDRKRRWWERGVFRWVAWGLLGVFGFLPLAGAEVSWVGGVGSFSDAANWSDGEVPDGTDNVLVGNGGTAQVNGFSPTQDATIDGSSTIEVFAGITSKLGVVGTLNVGVSGLGTITIGNQALVITDELISKNTFLGVQAGSQGVINSAGGFFSTSDLYVGYAGTGSMDFGPGSAIYSSTAYLGYAAGSFGTVEIQGGTWSTEGVFSDFNDVTVGAGGRGRMVLENSQVHLGNLIIADSAVSNNSVSVSGGNLTASETIFVGRVGEATFNSTGAAVQAKELFVGRNAGATGVATVSGGSLTLSADLHVGAEGTGTFTLSDGGTMNSDIANVGFGADAVGTLNIDSGDWTNTRAIFVGVSGQGTLNIGAQGAIHSESGYISQNTGGIGDVNITGGSWTMTNTLAVGVNGSGSLSVEGGEVSSVWSQLGLHTNSSGRVDLNGGSWTTQQDLDIGIAGDGEVHAVSGSTLTAKTIELAGSAGVSGSLIVADSTLSTENLSLGLGSGSVSFSNTLFKLQGGSSVVDTLLIYGFLSGDVVIQSGALKVDTQGGNAQIDSPLTGAGSLTKTGEGRLRLNTANTYQGGTVVEGGALELTGNANLGEGNVTLHTAELRAFTNSTLSGDLNGGIQLVSVAAGQTGTFSAVAGQTLTLAPLDFLLVAGSTLQVGSAGNTGNVVFAPTGAAALTADTAINVAAGTLTAGNSALAFMTTIAASTTVATGATLDFQDNLAGGSINSLFGGGTVNLGSNPANTLTVNSGNFSGNISGYGTLVKESSGTLVLSGQNAFIGGTSVNAGTLVVNGDMSFGAGQVTVNEGATLGGSGIMGTIFLEGGIVSPGNSPGTLTAENLYWNEGDLLFELGANQSSSDQIVTGGLQGFGTTYSFTFLDAGWVIGTTYNLINFEGTNIASADAFRFTNTGGFDGDFTLNSNSLRFTLTAIPEPSAGVLGFLGLILLQMLHRNRRTVSA